jgi:hypothetical protein
MARGEVISGWNLHIFAGKKSRQEAFIIIMNSTYIIYILFLLALLIIIGFIIMLISLRQLRKTQKEIKEHEDSDEYNKNYNWYRH